MNQRSSLVISPDLPWLAPMAGFTDLAFRMLCRERGAAVACTEMVSAKGLVYGSKGTGELLHTTPEDAPLVVQVFGSQPEFVGRAVKMLVERGFEYFDLNCGCPVKKVVKTGAGAALLREPERILRLVEVMAEAAGPGRVGIKTRTGVNFGDDTHLQLAERLPEAGAAWIALHPRTAVQGFSGAADHRRTAELAAASSLPVIASGDLYTAGDAIACLEQTKASAVMFARGALNDPGVFARFRNALAGGTPAPPSGPETAKTLLRHAELAQKHSDPRRALLKMRTAAPRYVKGFRGGKALRKSLVLCKTWYELEKLANEIFKLERLDERELGDHNPKVAE